MASEHTCSSTSAPLRSQFSKWLQNAVQPAALGHSCYSTSALLKLLLKAALEQKLPISINKVASHRSDLEMTGFASLIVTSEKNIGTGPIRVLPLLTIASRPIDLHTIFPLTASAPCLYRPPLCFPKCLRQGGDAESSKHLTLLSTLIYIY